jgi:hypothetical protein
MRVQKDGIQARKTLQLNRIKAEWGSSLRDLIPARLLPKLFSYHFLRIMAGISTRFTVEEVIPLLEETIQSRLAAKGRLNDPTALRCDLQKIADMEQLLPGVPGARMGFVMECVSIPKHQITGPITEVSDSSDESETSQASAKETLSSSAAPVSGPNRVILPLRKQRHRPVHDAIRNSPHTPPTSGHYTENAEEVSSEGELEDDEPASSSSEGDSDSLDMQLRHERPADATPTAMDSISGQFLEKTKSLGMTASRKSPATYFVAAPDPRKCGCTSDIRTLLRSELGAPKASVQMVKVVAFYRAHPGIRLCRDHLRSLFTSCGMKSNVKNDILDERLKWLLDQDGAIPEMIAEHPDWLHLNQLPEPESTLQHLYRFMPNSPPQIADMIDPETIMRRFAGPNAWKIWQETGNLITDLVFDYLKDPEVQEGIEWEFKLHRYHETKRPATPRQGWARGMVFSLPQQTLRQDPVWYALAVACRADHAWRLITWPYIAKNATASENTGFLHLDLNVHDYVESGAGGNLISSSVSLDDENERGCTTVVSGFQHHICEWNERILQRGPPNKGMSTDASKLYLPVDRQEWGEPQPQPCRKMGLRLTHPALIHGSTNQGTQQRRTLFAWHTAIHSDHSTLDGNQKVTWQDLSSSHREKMFPPTQPGGQVPKHRVPSEPFPLTGTIGNVYPLGDALVGARRYTDWQVMENVQVLLGPDEEKAMAMVKIWRQDLKREFLRQVKELKRMEPIVFGPNVMEEERNE